MKGIYKLAICYLVLIIGCSSSFASETEEDNWTFNLAPFYLWGINIDGDLSAGPVTAPVEVPFDEVFDSLEAAFIVHFETLYKNQWGFLVDVNYMDLENKMSLANGISSNVGLNLTLAEFSGYYRMQRDSHNFDFIAG